jgi:hypothetical protein
MRGPRPWWAPKEPKSRLVRRLLRLLERRPTRIVAGAVIVAAVSGAVITLVAHRADGSHQPAPRAACPHPLVVNVLASADLEQTVEDSARRFEQHRRTVDGCPIYTMMVYSNSPEIVARAWQQWRRRPEDPSPATFQQTGGPAPTIWIPGSSPEAWLAGGQPATPGRAAQQPPLAGSVPALWVRKPLAWTQPVVAVSPEISAQLGLADNSSGGWSWSDLLPKLVGAHVALVRARPTLSSGGLVHTLGLYQSLDDETALGLEKGISARTTGEGAYPATDEADILCRYQPADKKKVALLVDTQSLTRYQNGSGNCSSNSQPAELVSVPLAHVPGLDHPFVTVQWPGRLQARRLAASDDFENWLRSDLPARLGASAAGPQPPTPDHDLPVPTQTETTKAMDRYRKFATPGRVLIGLESSALMAEQDPTFHVGSQLDVAKLAVERSMGLLGGEDQVGLLTFQAQTGRRPEITDVVPLDVRPGRTSTAVDQLTTKLRTITADPDADSSPLYDAIDHGVHDVVGNHRDSGQIAAVVVITDGRRQQAGENLTTLQRKLLPLGQSVPVYVLTFHGGICSALGSTLSDTGGSCQQTTSGSVGRDLRQRLASLWKGTAQ